MYFISIYFNIKYNKSTKKYILLFIIFMKLIEMEKESKFEEITHTDWWQLKQGDYTTFTFWTYNTAPAAKLWQEYSFELFIGCCNFYVYLHQNYL